MDRRKRSRAPIIPLLLIPLAGCLGPPLRTRISSPEPPAVSAVVPPPPWVSQGGGNLIPVPDDQYPSLADDGGLADVATSVRQSIAYFRSLPDGSVFIVGGDGIKASRMAESLNEFLGFLDLPPEEFRRETRKLFKVYRSPGRVTFSAYYEHELSASLERGGLYQFPIYGPPPDLLESNGVVGRREGNKIVPYFSRREIDSDGVLEGKGLEIAWSDDPLDVFFLQVQGSGWLRVPGQPELLRVRFAAHNGLPYQSVGAAMVRKGFMTGEGTAREKMRRFMREHPEERQALLNVNPRYVFFKLDRGPEAPFALGALHRPLTPRRSVAADKELFPPGALAWMETLKPPRRRLVLVQDEGGAIKGPGRIDYFVGAGAGAEEEAVSFWTEGAFFIFVPR